MDPGHIGEDDGAALGQVFEEDRGDGGAAQGGMQRRGRAPQLLLQVRGGIGDREAPCIRVGHGGGSAGGDEGACIE